MKNSDVNNNSAAYGSGGIYITKGGSNNVKNDTIINTKIRNNYTTESAVGGGGMKYQGAGKDLTPYLDRLLIVNNSSGMGGGIYIIDCGVDFKITNSTISNNTSTFNRGGGIYNRNGDIKLVNTILWGNEPDQVYFAQVVNSQVASNYKINYSIIASGINGVITNNNASGDALNILDLDPLFMSEVNKDYNLTFYSPAIDAGDPDLDEDDTTWENDPDDQDPDGTRMDLGAYYFDNRDNKPPTVTITGPSNNNLKLGTKHNITWTTTDNFPTDTIKIKLEYSTNFSSGVWTKIADSLSNTGTYEWSVPNIPSSNGGIKITATDFGGNTAADSSGKKFEIYYPSVTLQSFSNPVFKISEQISISWTTDNEPNVDSVDIYYTIDDGVNWKDLALKEPNDGSYSWSVPNEPTSTAGIRIIAKEQFGYADTAEVKGLTIKIVYPTITSVTPSSDNIWWDTDEIKFTTNVIFDAQTVNLNSVTVTNPQENYSYTVSQNDNAITVKFLSNLITYDSISIKLDAGFIKSPFGYGFDGNGDGTPGDDYTITKKVYLPIDYDYSGTINATDVSIFVDYFKENNGAWETAPVVSGTVPYVKIEPDGKYDIDDMLTFVQFGNWYLQGASGKVSEDIGNTVVSLDTTIQSNKYEIPFSQTAKAIELYIKYDPTKLSPNIEPISGEVKLGHHDAEKGVISLIVYNPNSNELNIKWNHLVARSEATISLLMKTMDQNGNEVVKRSEVKVISVPTEFALHDNYPNPFNPSTTLRFDLPEVSDATITIYNMLGQSVRTFKMIGKSAGYHAIVWNATNNRGEQVGAGLYFYQLRSGDFVKTKKMVLLK